MSLSALAVPLAVCGFCCFGLARGRDIFADFCAGARAGLETALRIAPSTFAVMLALAMLRDSGALDLLCTALAPFFEAAGIPREAAPLTLLRPVSGAGASAMYRSILAACGPDSFAGRVASVMMGATDTTFYTLALYFSETRADDTRGALLSALSGDLAGFVVSALAVRLLLG